MDSWIDGLKVSMSAREMGTLLLLEAPRQCAQDRVITIVFLKMSMASENTINLKTRSMAS